MFIQIYLNILYVKTTYFTILVIKYLEKKLPRTTSEFQRKNH